jgi:RHS repeat-associated protein
MPQRTFDPGPGLADLRHGYNGKEKDAWGNSPTNYDYGFRIYNPAIGRFLSVDPLTKDYAMLTPYQFASNTPIQAIDLDGLEAWVVHYYYHSDKPCIDYKFHEELINPNGVWEIHHRYNAGTHTAVIAPYANHPDLFPNIVNNKFDPREQLKKPTSFDGYVKLLYGESALSLETPFGGIGVEVGGEGILFGYENINGKAKFLTLDTENFNLGGGVEFGIGLNYRKEFNIEGTFGQTTVDLTSIVMEGTSKENSLYNESKVGLPGLKFALGAGISFGLYHSTNKEKYQLTPYERKLHEAFNDPTIKPTQEQPNY